MGRAAGSAAGGFAQLPIDVILGSGVLPQMRFDDFPQGPAAVRQIVPNVVLLDPQPLADLLIGPGAWSRLSEGPFRGLKAVGLEGPEVRRLSFLLEALPEFADGSPDDAAKPLAVVETVRRLFRGSQAQPLEFLRGRVQPDQA